MKRVLPCGLATLIGATLLTAAIADPTTVGDILKRPVELHVGQRAKADPDNARRNYEAFLALAADDDGLRADALRRLGDLKLEAGEEDRIGRDLASGAPLATRDAIALYQELLRSVPNYARADAIYYQLARAYDAAGDESASLKALDTLLASFPTSPLAGEAQFRRGEYFFVRRRWVEAAVAYQALLSDFPQSDFREQATYKLGWSRFKLNEAEGAADAFAQLLDRQLVTSEGRERDVDTFSRAQRELVEDTLRVLSIIFSGDEGTTGIDKFLARRGEKIYADQLYASLGDWYASKERWTDAAAAYSGFASVEPNHERAPVLQSVAIDALRRGGFAELVLAEKQNFVERYGLDTAYWTHHNQSDGALVIREVKQNLQDLAAYYHERAQKTKDGQAYQNAARWYRAYLTQFPDDGAAADTAYLLADALFESGQFAAAVDEYLKVAYQYPENTHAAAAAYAAVVALDRQEQVLQGAEQAAVHEKGIDVATRFATTFSAHPESGAVLVRVARQQLEAKAYAKAAELAKIYLDRKSEQSPSLAIDARLVIVNAEFETQQFDLAEASATELLQRLPLSDGRRPAVEARLAGSVYRQAESLRSAGQNAEAALGFLRAARVSPQADVREAAEFDAAAAYLAAEQWADAIRVLEQFSKTYPSSTRLSEVTRRLASAYLSNHQYGTAARELELIASQYSTDPDAQRAALLQAADLYADAADPAAEIGALESYLRRFPSPFAAATEARQRLADLAARSHNDASRKSWLEEIVRTDELAGDARTDRTRSLAADASLELAAPLRASFKSIRLANPLKKSLEAKRTALQRAIKAYEKADAYGISEVSTQATFEMAELYRQLAQDLLQSERPRGLSADALEQYGLLLEEQAFPFEEKSIQLHEVNATRLAAGGRYEGAVRQSFAALAQLKPARYAKRAQIEDLSIRFMCGDAQPPLDLAVRFQEAVAASVKDPAGAASEFSAVSALVPDACGPLINLAILQSEAGNYAQAEAKLRIMLEKTPDNSTALDLYGVVLMQLGRFVDAEHTLRAALAADPESVRAHRNLGVLLDLYADRPAEAVVEWKRAIELEGGDKELEDWVAEVSHRVTAASHKMTEAGQ